MSFVDWCFRDRRSGAIVIGQWPNRALLLFIVANSAAWLLGQAAVGAPQVLVTGSRVVAVMSLAWWSADELLRGVKPWRRSLGAAALGYVLGLGWQQI